MLVTGTRRVGTIRCAGSSLAVVEWLLLLAALLPFLALCLFNHPTDDDFHDAVLARHLSAWESVRFYYLHWTGRYTSSFLYGLAYEAPNLQAWLVNMRLAPLLMILGLLGAGQFALGVIPYPWPASVRWRVAGYGLVLYLYGIPSVSSALYWFNGAAVYTSGIMLLLLLVGLAGRCHQANSSGVRTMWAVPGAGVAFMLVGTNELYMVVAIVGLVGWIFRSTRRFWPSVMLAAAVAGAVLTLQAPGNLVRASTVVNATPVYYRLLMTGAKAIYLTGTHLVQWLSSGVLLAITGLWLLALPAPVAPAVRWQWLGLAGMMVGLLVLLTLPTIWITNDVPARIWNALYFVFLLGWFAVCTIGRPQRWPADWQLSTIAARRWRAGMLLLVLLAHSTPVHQAYVDLFFKARRYDAAQQQRYVALQQARQQGQRELTVPPLLPNEYQYPATIFLHELELFPQDIANTGMADYFGLDSVRLQTMPLRTRRHFE